ncbi:dynamin family protein [Pseudonocardia sp. C8]|uniref:dynamin family protein n=1 Tax=Pseudonocardia sp. C8 TaxID=2762759 RepID=UPI001642BC6E|nr:dynamin family protein [Pseudonocardia sp. C8]MBC3190528.1 dynamin family protein [Pseudonocardia sp. C8]
MTRPPAPPTLVNRVRGLLHRACGVYGGGPAMPELLAATARLDEPLRVAIAGRVKAGKSTLLNALVGQDLAATDAGECTRVVTWYRDGHTYRVEARLRSGRRVPLPPGPTGGAADLGGLTAGEIDHVVVDWPSPALRAITLVDTPGLDSLSHELSGLTTAALVPGDGEGPAAVDAVVHLMRHLHATDVDFLEAFRDDPAERRPVNTIGVLARADEVGHGRPGALESAARVAARYAADPRVRALCQTVLPVAGLLAATAATLREDEFRAFASLAEAGEDEVHRLTLTAARFARAESTCDVEPARRAALLDRFGLFGVRLSVQLVESGVATTAAALSAELLHRSGLTPFREALTSRFTGRADVLKARSALRAVESVLRRYPVPAAAPLMHELELVTAGAHEFAEIRLLDTLRSGALLLADAERATAERLLGGDGVHPLSRLGLPVGSGRDEAVRAAQLALVQWQRRAEHPSSGRDVREACRVLVRTCEGLLLGATEAARAPGMSSPPAVGHGWPAGRVVDCS